MPPPTRVGFLGLGKMGSPMALNLSRSFPLTVWNRTLSKYPALTSAGAAIGATPSEVVEKSDVIFSMLFDGAATQAIFDDSFKRAIRGRTLVNTASVEAEVSRGLAEQVKEAGGEFLEMPVSGSRIPAEQGQLVGMMAGDPAVAERIRPLVQPMATAAVYCGPIGSGLKTKYAVNLMLVTLTAGLAESMSLARAMGLDLGAFGEVLNAGPMASNYSRIKIAKMLEEDWSAQASIKDCHNSTKLIGEAGKEAGADLPLAKVCETLYRQARESGMGEEDMIAITKFLK